MKKVAIKENFIFPYLFDETQIVAKNYDAACTPDFFIFNNSKKLVYRGQLDDSRPGNDIPLNGKDIREVCFRKRKTEKPIRQFYNTTRPLNES